jgi:hypothetical protein
MTWDKGYEMTTPSHFMDIDCTEAAKQINGDLQTHIDPENHRSSMAVCSIKSKLTRRYGQSKKSIVAITCV